MKHTVMGPQHVYETDLRPTAELLIRRLMDRGYWFNVSCSGGVYSIECGVDPKFVNDTLRMNVEGSIKGNYKRAIKVG